MTIFSTLNRCHSLFQTSFVSLMDAFERCKRHTLRPKPARKSINVVMEEALIRLRPRDWAKVGEEDTTHTHTHINARCTQPVAQWWAPSFVSSNACENVYRKSMQLIYFVSSVRREPQPLLLPHRRTVRACARQCICENSFWTWPRREHRAHTHTHARTQT